MKRLSLAGLVLTLFGSVASAGVVIEMEVKGPGAAEAGTDTVYVEGEMLRMDPQGSQRGEKTSLLFRDETMWMIDHDKKRCQTIDKQGIEQMGAQLGGMMKEMEAQMAQIPPEQRAMMEQMMKGKMPGMGQASAPRRIEKGGTEQVGKFNCTVHTLYAGDEKVWEVCAAKESAVAEFAAAMGAFRAMSEFTEQLREGLQHAPVVGRMLQTPFAEMKRIDGVPVRVRNFAGGKVKSESTLKTVARRDLEKSLFSTPEGYKVSKLEDEMNRRR